MRRPSVASNSLSVILHVNLTGITAQAWALIHVLPKGQSLKDGTWVVITRM